MALTRRQRALVKNNYMYDRHNINELRDCVSFIKRQYRRGRNGAYLDSLCHSEYDFIRPRIESILRLLGIEYTIKDSNCSILIDFKD